MEGSVDEFIEILQLLKNSLKKYFKLEVIEKPIMINIKHI